MPAWKDRVKQAVATGGTGALVLGAASSGYQAFGAADDGKTFYYTIEDGTAWEIGYGVYTHSGTSFARTSRDGSSTGSALTVSTSAFLFVDLTAAGALSIDNAARSLRPGGRLTLTSATPVTISDVTAATSIFYTPYISDVITLWNGNLWVAVQFTETTLALGTLTSGKNYDVFAYLSSGVLALESLAWTSDTARATAITTQDGRYCKSGDKTRLYLGTFRTISTTQTADTGGGVTSQVGAKRFLWNMYNRVPRSLIAHDTTDNWSYTTTTIRQANGASGNKIEVVRGLDEDVIDVRVTHAAFMAGSSAFAGPGLDTTTAFSGTVGEANYSSTNSTIPVAGGAYCQPCGLGYHYISWNEKGGGGTCIHLGDDGGSGMNGIRGWMPA